MGSERDLSTLGDADLRAALEDQGVKTEGMSREDMEDAFDQSGGDTDDAESKAFAARLEAADRLVGLVEGKASDQKATARKEMAETPWRVAKHGDTWRVVNDTGRVLGEHPTKDEALQQLRAVYANVSAEAKAFPADPDGDGDAGRDSDGDGDGAPGGQLVHESSWARTFVHPDSGMSATEFKDGSAYVPHGKMPPAGTPARMQWVNEIRAAHANLPSLPKVSLKG